MYGEDPPEIVAVNVTVWPEAGLEGLELMLTVNGAWCILHPVSGWSSQPEKEWSWAEQQLGPSQNTKPWKSISVVAAVVWLERALGSHAVPVPQ